MDRQEASVRRIAREAEVFGDHAIATAILDRLLYRWTEGPWGFESLSRHCPVDARPSDADPHQEAIAAMIR